MNTKYTLLLSIIMAMVLVIVTMFAFAEEQMPFTLLGGQENSSPSDWVKENQIQVYPQRVVLDIPGATWAGFTNTNSMDPFIDETANAIEISPSHPDAIQVGDVIAYKTVYGILIHRVIKKGIDEQGIYYQVKGDNNRFQDPFKVRFADVQGVVVAVIY